MKQHLKMDPKKQARRNRIAELVQAWAEAKTFRHLDADGQWRETQPRGEWLFHEPERWRVAEAEPEKCAMCGHTHDAGTCLGCGCKQFVPRALAGPRPTPPDGCELLAPGVEASDYWWDGARWVDDRNTFPYARVVWRARRKAEPKLERVSDHDMLVAKMKREMGWIELLDYHNLRDRYIAQEGGNNG